MITRGRGRVLVTIGHQRIGTCSTGDVSSTGADIGGTLTPHFLGGSLVDRLTFGELYNMAEPYAAVYSTVGSTALDKSVQLSIRLQHGNSSAGGDMADLSTGSTGQWPATRNAFTTAESTSFNRWSTSPMFIESNPGAYDLGGAGRYLRAVANLSMGAGSASPAWGTTATSTAGPYIVAGMRLGNGQPEVPSNSVLDQFSTSTSTST